LLFAKEDPRRRPRRKGSTASFGEVEARRTTQTHRAIAILVGPYISRYRLAAAPRCPAALPGRQKRALRFMPSALSIPDMRARLQDVVSALLPRRRAKWWPRAPQEVGSPRLRGARTRDLSCARPVCDDSFKEALRRATSVRPLGQPTEKFNDCRPVTAFVMPTS
jgi:hypothetical protein